MGSRVDVVGNSRYPGRTLAPLRRRNVRKPPAPIPDQSGQNLSFGRQRHACQRDEPERERANAALQRQRDEPLRHMLIERRNRPAEQITFRDTGLHAGVVARGGEPGRVERFKDSIPMGRGGQPEEVARAILWLASAEAFFITGTFLDLTGGK